MPIVLAQPQPFIPGIAAGYGAAEAGMRNNAAIANAAEATARTQLAARAQAQAEAQARQRAQLAQQEMAQRQTIADYQNLQSGLEAQGRFQLGQEGIRADRQGRFDQMSFTAARDQFHAAAEERQLVKRGEVQNWLMGQELTFKEQQELRRMQAAVSEVENIKGLPREARDDMILQIRTGIDPLRQRQQVAQTKMLEQRAAQYESEVALQAKATAQTAGLVSKMFDGINYYDPVTRAQVEAEMGAVTPEQAAVFGPAGVAAREDEIKRRVLQRQPKMAVVGLDSVNGVAVPRLAQVKSERPELDPAKVMEMDFKLADKEIDLQMKIADAESKAALEGRTLDLSGAKESLKSIQSMRQGLRGGGRQQGGRPGQAGAAGPKAFESDNPMDWNDGFDANNPPPGKPAEWVARNRQRMREVQDDPRYHQEQKNPVLAARARREQIAAKPNKTPEEVAEFNRLGQVQLPDLPAPAAAPPPQRRPVHPGSFF